MICESEMLNKSRTSSDDGGRVRLPGGALEESSSSRERTACANRSRRRVHGFVSVGEAAVDREWIATERMAGAREGKAEHGSIALVGVVLTSGRRSRKRAELGTRIIIVIDVDHCAQDDRSQVEVFLSGVMSSVLHTVDSEPR